MFGSLLSCIKISQPAWVSKTHRPCVFCFVSGAYKKLARFFFFKFLFSFFVLSFKPSPLKPACAENKSVLSCVTSRGAKRINSSSVVLCRAVTFPRQLRTTHPPTLHPLLFLLAAQPFAPCSFQQHERKRRNHPPTHPPFPHIIMSPLFTIISPLSLPIPSLSLPLRISPSHQQNCLQ